ncbi:SAF domain-containing protein [Syntrophomonas palmitatica]|uniref:SAF domain-containing protein n=1 Tax=Syntrophomonas palmitatica TaxID=402877 RepID=UPI0006D04B04|nr:SAF domain-containing protein [Syntrophomonas palmitatica]
MEFIKKNLSLIIGIIIAVIAAFIIYFTVKAMSPTMPVVVANQNMRVGTVITKEMLTTKNFPAGNVPTTAFSSPQELIGKSVINGPIVEGDIVRSEHLSLDGSLMAILKTYANGWTAVELPEGTGAGMKGLKKGDKIDIYGETGSAQGSIVTEIVKSAVILSVPEAEVQTQYVVAVPSNYAASIAESVVRSKHIAITLPSKETSEPVTQKTTDEQANIDTLPEEPKTEGGQ